MMSDHNNDQMGIWSNFGLVQKDEDEDGIRNF
jgi:hypothetical protein